jgi:hypothetical protein
MLQEFAVGVGTIFFLILLWTPLAYTMNTITTHLSDITPASIMNTTVNATTIKAQYGYGYTTMYFSLFIITILILLWIVKVAVQQKEKKFI